MPRYKKGFKRPVHRRAKVLADNNRKKGRKSNDAISNNEGAQNVEAFNFEMRESHSEETERSRMNEQQDFRQPARTSTPNNLDLLIDVHDSEQKNKEKGFESGPKFRNSVASPMSGFSDAFDGLIHSLSATVSNDSRNGVGAVEKLSISGVAEISGESDNEDSSHGLIHSHRTSLPVFSNDRHEPISEEASTSEMSATALCLGRRVADLDHLLKSLQDIAVHPQFDCSLADMFVSKVFNDGLRSTFTLTCKMCCLTKRISTCAGNVMNINQAAVSGVVAVGGGCSQLEEFLASLNMKSLTPKAFRRNHGEFAVVVQQASLTEMLEAGREETAIAVAEGSVDENGVPLITVICDGTWAKRSYRSKYDSSSGMAAIIGYRTGKVLFLSVKNKYCTVCTRWAGETPPAHTCFKNYNGSSTAMESESIVEGFKNSLQMHNLIYHRMIADGDSSVHRKLVDSLPYGSNLLVEKIECRNHILRNYGNRLRDLSKNRKVGDGAVRHLLNSNILRLRSGITCAIKYWQKKDVPTHEKINSLRRDIVNSPFHVFGDHKRCAAYFCTKNKPGELNHVPQMQQVGLFKEIQSAVNLVANKTSSLIWNVDNNRVEGLNSVVAKMTGGKRVNFCQKNAYKARCEAAVLSLNSGGEMLRRIHKSVTKMSPGKVTKQFIKSRQRQRLYNARKKRTEGKSCRKKLAIASADNDYGPHAADGVPDLTPTEYAEKEEAYKKSLSTIDRQAVELATRGQSSNSDWHQLRRKMVTASNFGQICKMRAATPRGRLLGAMLYTPFTGGPATRYGIEKEALAKEDLENELGKKIEDCGLFIDEEFPYLGASPDGIIDEDTIVEVKCPYKAREMTPVDAIQNEVIKFCTLQDGNLTLKKNESYMYQVQGQLHITRRQKCIFAVWTPFGMLRQTIERDDEFWESMKPKLVDFFNQSMLPEILDSRKERNLPFKEPTSIVPRKKRKPADD